MGVSGLWKLLEPCGNPVPIESLEGKILAIDISIWLHQVVKGYQDSKGSLLPQAHLLGLFHRLCKLLFYRVRPVFVFDGCVPQIKRDTIARRQHQRSKLNSEAERIQTLLLQSLAKEKVVQQALGINSELLIKSPRKRHSMSKEKNEKDYIFKLPDIPSGGEADNLFESKHGEITLLDSSTSADETSFDDSNPWREYNANLQAIDVRSEHFKSLPAEVRHEILVDIKETRKQSSWGRLNDLPSGSEDFSSFQMKRLLNRRAVQESIEETEKEMGGKALTYADLENMFTEEGILNPYHVNQSVKPICSDEAVRFTLVRDLKNTTKSETNDSYIFSKIKNTEEISENQKEKLNQKYPTDLEMAIALSVQDDFANVYNEVDYEYESNKNLKLNHQQRNKLKNTAIGPARSYMIEYGGMNGDEVKTILDKTLYEQSIEDLGLNIRRSGYYNMYKGEKNLEGNEDKKKDASDDSETDSDLEEVDTYNPAPTEKLKQNLEVTIIPKQPVEPERDIFSDVFMSTKEEDTGIVGAKESFGKFVQTLTENDKSVLLSSNNNKQLDECGRYTGEKEISESPKTEKTNDTAGEVCRGLYLEVRDASKTDSGLEGIHTNQPLTRDKIIQNLEITIRPKHPAELEDDIFSDIFMSSKEENALIDGKNSQGNFVQILTENDNNKSVTKQTEERKKFGNTKQKSIKKPAPNKIITSSILDDLKKQAGNIKNINLDTVDIGESNSSCETIEIYDSDDQKHDSVITSSKSPKFKDSSKVNSINKYFDTKYVIKRTPEKYPIEKEEGKSPGVKSPFFVNKSPLSQRKGTVKIDQSSSHGQKLSKASKTLFGGSNKSKEDNKQLQSKDLLDKAVTDLKQHKTAKELQIMARDLKNERLDLENERNRQDRMGATINQNMHRDCQRLLKIFGIPYIIAPMEAEAQCAFLESANLTDGTVTDDSDIWLFGGRTVYKNFFEQNKHVLKFEASKIKQSFNCDREKFIQLACLVGSDYTTGIHGIGTVTALEILATFSTTPKGAEEISNNEDITTANVIASLCRFREWVKTYKDLAQPIGSSSRLNLRKKLKNIELYKGFPNPAVIEAYLNPTVDSNNAPFRWGYPEVDSIHEFTKNVFGWTRTRTDELLKPVLKRITDKQTQTSIRNYFTIKSAIKPRELKVSKRVQKAIDTMTGKLDEAEGVSTKKKKKNQSDIKKHKKAFTNETQQRLKSSLEDNACTDSTILTGEVHKFKPQIPESKHLIPQREKDLESMP